MIDTHVHADHFNSSCMQREATGARIAFGEQEGIECADILLKGGDEWECVQFNLKSFSTPGYTDTCTSFYIEGRLFTGDTLLMHGCGHTDFQQGDLEK